MEKVESYDGMQQVAKPLPIKKIWVDKRTGWKGAGTSMFLAFQIAIWALIYITLCVYFPVFFYSCLAINAVVCICAMFFEKDAQCRISWLIVFICSCGCAFIVYFMADRRVCYSGQRKKLREIRQRTDCCAASFDLKDASPAVSNDITYVNNASGFVPYQNTKIKYYSEGSVVFGEIVDTISKAHDFVFMEYFMVSDGTLLEELIKVFDDICSRGVKVRFLYDDQGTAGTLKSDTIKRIKATGVEFEVFNKMFSVANFGLNYRDHRKIVVVDGKTAFVAGCNLTDNCVNRNVMEGYWKDAGVRFEGEAVDGLSTCFMRQWEIATGRALDFNEYLRKYDTYESSSYVMPYAGGPELEADLCRGVYLSLITGAHERLWMSSPYLLPDEAFLDRIIEKAQAGVDVRIVLPSVPDYAYIHRVSKFHAEKVIKAGARVYYMDGAFVHMKVMLTENAMTVGSTNLDMRAFYEELDNGVYTNDPGCMKDAEADFMEIFRANQVADIEEHSVGDKMYTDFCRLISPLL
ncbi:MAG: phosphatidylserine/phosphatidylglycerophosphate/cardiolipin synthase family protein [Clostridia bacterium]|nr:phosphatidylserine/phosphatidylglycerophosphate/cardiolipin synthase family protein [Clostridia bacterium]